jgi:hypothetical protein
MAVDYQVPEPLLFNPMKHHLGFIREYISLRADEGNPLTEDTTRDLKHLGTTVMDVYRGSLSISDICAESEACLKLNGIVKSEHYANWIGNKGKGFRIISLSDGSEWTLKFNYNKFRYIHLFPARNGPHTFRIKANTLKSAILFLIIIDKDFVSSNDLNRIRPLIGLSPLKETADHEAILEMVKIIRGS